jgi:hypothetical protein
MTVIAVAIVAMRTGSWFWARLLFTVVLTFNLGAVLGSIFLRGTRRTFWIGFAIFGWTYWSIANFSSLRIAEHQLFTKQLNVVLKDYVPKVNDGHVIGPNSTGIGIFSFERILHSVFGLSFSVVGGIIGLWFYHSRKSFEANAKSCGITSG